MVLWTLVLSIGSFSVKRNELLDPENVPYAVDKAV
jgi:hypothetical protein